MTNSKDAFYWDGTEHGYREKLRDWSYLYKQIESYVVCFDFALSLDPKHETPLARRRLELMLCALAEYQATHCKPFGTLVSKRGGNFATPDSFPAIPTDAFRTMRIACFAESETKHVFRTSGTTFGARGTHEFPSLNLYELSIDFAATAPFFHSWRDKDRHFVQLAPRLADAPDSSLSYMLDSFARRFPRRTQGFVAGKLAHEDIAAAFRGSQRVIACGTSFAWVNFLDSTSESFQLPEGSILMQTGGFKGKSRELNAVEMRKTLSERMGVPLHRVVSEYSMTELSSQLWGNSIMTGIATSPELFWAPPWVRVTARDPQTLERLPDGQKGILRIDDLANVYSCCAIQTSDFGIIHPAGVELCGRDPNAVPRGCSLAIEEMLG